MCNKLSRYITFVILVNTIKKKNKKILIRTNREKTDLLTRSYLC